MQICKIIPCFLDFQKGRDRPGVRNITPDFSWLNYMSEYQNSGTWYEYILDAMTWQFSKCVLHTSRHIFQILSDP